MAFLQRNDQWDAPAWAAPFCLAKCGMTCFPKDLGLALAMLQRAVNLNFIENPEVHARFPFFHSEILTVQLGSGVDYRLDVQVGDAGCAGRASDFPPHGYVCTTRFRMSPVVPSVWQKQAAFGYLAARFCFLSSVTLKCYHRQRNIF
jgi:hypothetical protein